MLMTNPLLRRLNDLQATTVMLSGNPADSARIRGHRFARAAAGRAMLFDDGDQPTHLQLVLVPEAVGSTQSHLRNQQGEEFGS
jgi:S-DNA-T family DNA segregation ATPase FtsK/SpoIIIE